MTWNQKLNAFYMVLTVLIAIAIASSTYFSHESNSCNYEANQMLINKTQNFLEKQNILIEQVSDIGRRDVFEAIGNKIEAQSAQDRIPQKHKEYNNFIKESKEYDILIKEKLNSCYNWELGSYISLFLLFVLLIVQMVVSILYLRRY